MSLLFMLCSLLVAVTTGEEGGLNSTWTVLGTVNHPGNVIASNNNDYNENVMFAFGGTGTEVEVAYTTTGGNITTATIPSEQEDSDFGGGLATFRNSYSGGDVAIGAPSYVNGTTVLGAVSAYRFKDVVEEGGGGGVIEKRGSTIVGGYDLSRGPDDTGFGSAIAYMRTDEIVVCAPNDNTLLLEEPHGRCFLYDYTIVDQDTTEFDWIQHPSTGTALNAYVGDAGDSYGYAVSGGCCVQDDPDVYDIFYAAGSPTARDGSGQVNIVSRNEQINLFESIALITGDNEEQGACGTSVASAGGFVAFGCPGAGANDNGLVRVIRLSGPGYKEELGSGILGMDGDKLGDVNTIAVTSTAAFPFDQDVLQVAVSITAATASGLVKQFYFLNNEWIEMSNPYDNGLSGTKIAGTDVSFEPSFVAVSNPSGSQIIEFSYDTPAPTESPVATPAPVTPAPVTPAPTTMAPTTASPTTSPPVVPPPASGAAERFSFVAITAITVGLWLLTPL